MSGVIGTVGSRSGRVGRDGINSDGHVVQVKYVQKTSGGDNSSTSSTYVDHTNLVLAITPSSSSNKSTFDDENR